MPFQFCPLLNYFIIFDYLIHDLLLPTNQGRFFCESYMSLATQVHSHGHTRAQRGVKAYHIGVGVTGVLKGELIARGGAQR